MLAWIGLGATVLALVYSCAALARLSVPASTPGPTGPRLEADYSVWTTMSFSPLLASMMAEAAKELHLTPFTLAFSPTCLLPEGGCDAPPESSGEGSPSGTEVPGFPQTVGCGAGAQPAAEGGPKCKPSLPWIKP